MGAIENAQDILVFIQAIAHVGTLPVGFLEMSWLGHATASPGAPAELGVVDPLAMQADGQLSGHRDHSPVYHVSWRAGRPTP